MVLLRLPYLFGFQGVFAITAGRAASPFSLALTWAPNVVGDTTSKVWQPLGLQRY